MQNYEYLKRKYNFQKVGENMPNSRYGGYQYETSPRKLKPEYKTK